MPPPPPGMCQAAAVQPPPHKVRAVAAASASAAPIKTKEVVKQEPQAVTQPQQLYETDTTLGMLLRNGKQSKQIFKPYAENVKKSGRRHARARPGFKRKHDEIDGAVKECSGYGGDSAFLEKSISSEFYEEDEVTIIEEQKATTINNLFPEILTEIFDKLDVQSKGRAAQVCRTWRDACYRKSTWKGVEAKLHIGKSNPQMYQSLQRRGITRVQVLSLKRTVREMMTCMTRLERLNLSGCYNLTDSVVEGCFAKKDFPNLKVLDLSLCKEIHDSSVALMTKKCPNIRDLDLSGCTGVTNQGLKEVASNLKGLKRLNLRSCRQVTDSGIEQLVNHCGSTLEELSIQDCQKLTDESLNILSKSTKLASLNLSFCVSVTDTGLKSLSRLRTLRSLNLRSCDNVSDLGVSFLTERNLGLESVDVSFCANVTNTSLVHMAQGFPGLVSLCMTTCSITDQGLKRLAASSSGQKTLESLNIGQCTSVTDEGLKFLSDEKSGLKRLKFLDLYGCPKVTPAAVDKIKADIPSLQKINQNL